MIFKNKILLLIGQLFGRKQYYNIGLILHYISHRMMGIGNYENEYLSGEEYVIKLIKKIVGNKKLIFFDVGAGSVSENTQLIQKYFTKYQGFLFEPMPQTYHKLKKKYSKYKKIKIINLALSNKSGILNLYDYSGQQTNHATFNKEILNTDDINMQIVKIKQDSISNFNKKNKIKNINFLKIDVEGLEYKVMLGAKKYLKSINFIQFEFNKMNIYSKVRFKDFYDLLNPNFNLYRIYQNGLLPIKKYEPLTQEIYEFQNYLAINKIHKFSHDK